MRYKIGGKIYNGEITMAELAEDLKKNQEIADLTIKDVIREEDTKTAQDFINEVIQDEDKKV